MIRSFFMTLGLLAASSSWAVQTRNCPERITAELSNPSVFATEEVQSHERHSRYTEPMMREALSSRERAEKYLPLIHSAQELVLKKRENGRCIYRSEDSEDSRLNPVQSLKARKVVLYTKQGADYYRDEFELPYGRRESEVFVAESLLRSYDESRLELSENLPSELRVIVNYPCYDDHCHTEARIGAVNQVVR